MSYAKVLGATRRQDGYLEGNGYLVSWCVGHLVELAPPNIYDAKYVKWSIADLPILPQKWQYLVSASTKKQFGIMQKLMHRPDVDSIVNSCDSGREGELIFRLVYQQAGCKKPFSRLWLSSMEENAIREGFAHLKPSTEYDALYNAALCRERADWMVGINASRSLVTGMCANYDRESGLCLPLDCACYMLHKCWTGAYCRYFREAVLPLDPELQAALTTEGISPELRACAVCGKAFLPEGRQAYCSDVCKAEGNRRKSRERMRKMREKRPGGCYDLSPPKA